VVAKPTIVTPAPVAVKPIPDGLTGVRRKGETAPIIAKPAIQMPTTTPAKAGAQSGKPR
jgi:hypothetical protein